MRHDRASMDGARDAAASGEGSARRRCGLTGGNFRLIQRLFSQIERILQISELRLITKEVVEAARENLVIGTL